MKTDLISSSDARWRLASKHNVFEKINLTNSITGDKKKSEADMNGLFLLPLSTMVRKNRHDCNKVDAVLYILLPKKTCLEQLLLKEIITILEKR
jgi:hypothetical protein